MLYVCVGGCIRHDGVFCDVISVRVEVIIWFCYDVWEVAGLESGVL